MFLVAGLGNPGAKYAHNRHNIGFLAADRLADTFRASPWSKKFQGEVCEARLRDERLLLLKPQTFMNLSGESVGTAARFYKIAPEDVVVFYDELDLPLGKLRVKRGGGHGGHNGIKSIDAHLGTQYWRVRIGIGRPEHKDAVTNYVLGDFTKAEWEIQTKMLDVIGRYLLMLLANDEAGFMNKVALEMNPPPPKPKPVPKPEPEVTPKPE